MLIYTRDGHVSVQLMYPKSANAQSNEYVQDGYEASYDQVIRYIRRRWRRNPAAWMGGYLGPAASELFDRGALLLPNYIPPGRSEWIERLAEQHPI
jgi:hypothetical protein